MIHSLAKAAYRGGLLSKGLMPSDALQGSPQQQTITWLTGRAGRTCFSCCHAKARNMALHLWLSSSQSPPILTKRSKGSQDLRTLQNTEHCLECGVRRIKWVNSQADCTIACGRGLPCKIGRGTSSANRMALLVQGDIFQRTVVCFARQAF